MQGTHATAAAVPSPNNFKKGPNVDSWNVIAPLYDQIDQYVSYARRFVLDPTEAEDVCHDALMDLKKNIERGTEIKNPKAYLKRMVRNIAIDRNASYDESRDAGPHLSRLAEARTLDTAGEALFNVAFNDALAHLPDAQRSAFVLCELRGLSRREAAAQLKISSSAVDRNYESARKALARELR